MECPYCGSQSVEYIGIDDGYGDDGDRMLDIYNCHRCNMQFASNVYVYSTLEQDEGYECIMCGKPTAKHSGYRCSECEQVWNS